MPKFYPARFFEWVSSNIGARSKRIVELADPVDDQDAATKKYIDDRTVTRSVWLPASVFEATIGSPSYGVIRDEKDSFPYWALDDTAEEGVGTSFFIPNNVIGNITQQFWFTMAGANTSKTVKIYIYHTPIAEGELITKARESGNIVVPVPDTANEVDQNSIAVDSAAQAGKMRRVTFYRQAYYETDTAVGDLYFLGIRLSWTEKIMTNQ